MNYSASLLTPQFATFENVNKCPNVPQEKGKVGPLAQNDDPRSYGRSA